MFPPAVASATRDYQSDFQVLRLVTDSLHRSIARIVSRDASADLTKCDALVTASERGIALPMTLMVIMLIASATAIFASVAKEGYARLKVDEASNSTFSAAEGGTHSLLADMSLYGALFDQLAPLPDSPAEYREYSPSNFVSSNGIPSCDGFQCQRSLFPVGGGLLKNFGPLESDGFSVDVSNTIIDQLDEDTPPEQDAYLSGLGVWTQLERLDETTPGQASVGGNLSSGPAEGGNARSVRYRLTAVSLKSLRGRRGRSSLVFVVEMPVR